MRVTLIPGLVLAFIFTVSAQAQPVSEAAGERSEIASNLWSIAQSGEIAGEKVRFVLPFSALGREAAGTTNKTFFGAIDGAKYLISTSFAQIARDAADFAWGDPGVVIDNDTKYALRDIVPMWKRSRLKLESKNEEIRNKNWETNIPAKIAALTINRARYVIIDIPVNAMITGLRILRVPIQAGFIGVGMIAYGGVSAVAALSHVVKAMISGVTVGAASAIYLGAELYVGVRKSARPAVCSRLLFY